MSELKNILVATDFSDPSTVAARVALDLAALAQGTIHVVHVVEQLAGYQNLRFPPDTPPTLMRPLVDGARHALDAFLAAQLPGVDASRQHLRAGRPYEEILHAARDTNADLLIQGTHGRRGVDRITLGSVAERVTASAPCPVLTVQKPLALKGGLRILVATDFSPSAERAARTAAALARQVGAQLSILAVMEQPGGGLWRYQPAEDRAQAEARVRAQVDAFAAATLGGAKVDTVHVRAGHVAAEIVATAQQEHVELLAMGAAGASGVRAWVLGSVAQRVMRDCTIPLLTARAA